MGAFAETGHWDQLKEELEATQNEVKLSMAQAKDQDLVTLVTVVEFAVPPEDTTSMPPLRANSAERERAPST